MKFGNTSKTIRENGCLNIWTQNKDDLIPIQDEVVIS